MADQIIREEGKKGFTLIELLVVISIIALLATVVMSAVNSAREKAEIAAWKETGLSFRNAMELYRDAEGEYPSHTSISITYLSNFYLDDYMSSDIDLPSFISDSFYGGGFSCDGVIIDENVILFGVPETLDLSDDFPVLGDDDSPINYYHPISSINYYCLYAQID